MCCEYEIRIFKEIKKYLFLTLKCSFVVLSQWCHLGAVAGVGRKGFSDRLTLTRWRNAIFRVARATN